MPIPTPEPGLVISYAYLWHHEHLAGADEGRKNRPVLVMLVTRRAGGESIEVTVLPITHRAPDNPDWAVEIPSPVKRHLGLDDSRSWIIVAEGNDFLWPGYDLRPAPGRDRCDYGFLPPRFFNQVLAGFDRLRATGKARLTPRD
jgi:hypothetical protein